MSPPELEAQQNHTRLLWVLAAMAAMALPQALHVAPWVMLAALLISLWRLAVEFQGWPLFGGPTRIAFGLLAFVGVFATYHTFNGVEAGSSLLILLAVLKLMEARGLRDYFFVLAITLVIGIANFLYDQTIPLAIYMIPAVWLAIAALLNIAHPDVTRSVMTSIRVATRLLLPALPVAVALFLLFPRMPGPLWGLSTADQTGITGLSPKMSPDSISRLARSDAIAFRVQFDGQPPTRSQLYWRAMVLHHFDGSTWTRGIEPIDNNETLTTSGEPFRYRITLEPNDLRVLYALDLPVQ
ncbi:MAG: DUF3488 domain-containing protein, partial [Gammaproteobacteria bacterium]|nr:DUF3488 domain-containing protein [Gammaproteobacteria bacterium]